MQRLRGGLTLALKNKLSARLALLVPSFALAATLCFSDPDSAFGFGRGFGGGRGVGGGFHGFGGGFRGFHPGFQGFAGSRPSFGGFRRGYGGGFNRGYAGSPRFQRFQGGMAGNGAVRAPGASFSRPGGVGGGVAGLHPGLRGGITGVHAGVAAGLTGAAAFHGLGV